MRRSDSGAAVRLTRDGELGVLWATTILRAGKPATVFPPHWAELLRPIESRSSPPPYAADCNSTGLVAFTAGGEHPKRDVRPARLCEPQVSIQNRVEVALAWGSSSQSSSAERHRRSESGAAVRPTRGSALGRASAARRAAQSAAPARRRAATRRSSLLLSAGGELPKETNGLCFFDL